LIAVLLLAGGAAAHSQAVDVEDAFSARIAQERAARGLPVLASAADLKAVAQRHAQRMADRGEPFHNPNLGSEVGGWSMLAENVGMGPDVDSVHQRFMASSQHAQNILSTELTQVGIGAVRSDDGQIWVVEIFRRPDTAAAAPPPTTAPPTTPPPATAPPVTAPPATAPAAPAPPPPPVPPAPAPAPPVSAPPAPEVAASTVSRTVDGEVIAAGAASVAVATEIGARPQLAELRTSVPAAAFVAAFLLAGVVGLQAGTLRRLGLLA
jgi:hypothetical protein